MLDEICALLGGRAAEEVFIGKISSGAMNDLERVTKQAYGMISYLGMSDKLPNLSYYDSTGQDYTFQKPYSDDTAKLIDAEVKSMVEEQYERAKKMLQEHTEGHNRLAQILLEKEIIYAETLEEVFGKRSWVSRSQEILENKNSSVSLAPESASPDEDTDISRTGDSHPDTLPPPFSPEDNGNK